MTHETIPHAKDFLGEGSAQVFANQLLLAAVLREGGELSLPVDLVDATGGYTLRVEVNPTSQRFILRVEKKH